MAATTYVSFLVRLWREGNSRHGGTTAGWQGEVEHIQSGGRWAFCTIEELLDFLRRQAENQDVVGRPAGQ